MLELSPGRLPVFRIRVYPPGRVAILGATTLKSSFTASLSLKIANAVLREWVVSSLIW
jgi:hypothetical protein